MTGFSSRSARCVQPAHAVTLSPQPYGRTQSQPSHVETIIEKHGFVHYAKEWLHDTLRDEPYPDMYFDFPVR